MLRSDLTVSLHLSRRQGHMELLRAVAEQFKD